MPIGEKSVPKPGTAALSELPAGPILIRLRGVLLTTGAAALVYTALGSGSRSQCSGGADADGPIPGRCVSLVLHPSWLVYAALVIIVLVAIGRVARRAWTMADAMRVLDRTGIIVTLVALGSAVIALVWLFAVPLDVVRGTGTVIFPFPFSSPELTFTDQP